MQRLMERLETFTGHRVAVVGGGMAGAEMASALRERFRRLGRDVSIELVTSGDTLFRQLQPRFSKLADRGTRILEDQGITIRWGSRVISIGPLGPVLDNGDFVFADLTLVAAGVEFSPVPGLDRLKATPSGRYVADGFLRAVGRNDIWLAGDIAEVVRPGDNGPCPADALWAMKQGDLAGANIARAVLGRSIKPFGFRGLGQAAGLASGSGISELWGMTFQGRLAWLLRVFFFAWFMPRRTDGAAAAGILFADWAAQGFEAVRSGLRLAPRQTKAIGESARSRAP
jgi:NADH dehydrogenase